VIGLSCAASVAQVRRPSVLRPLKPLRSALPPVLARAIQASAKLRFAGRRTVTVLRDGQPRRHEEIVMRDGPRTRVEFPADGDYAGQVIVENAAERRHFLPAANEVRVLPPRREEGIQRLRALAKQGRVATAPGDRVAGVATIEVTVADAAGNPLQRLAIDPVSGMLLRRRLYDATGVEIGGFVYTRIDLAPAPFDPALFRIDRKGVQTTTPWDTLRRLAKSGDYQAVGLAESTGYRLDGVRIARGPLLLQQYVGPNNRRLFLYQLRNAVDSAQLQKRAARLHSLSWSSGDLTFVLLGPQDDATLARLKESVGRQP